MERLLGALILLLTLFGCSNSGLTPFSRGPDAVSSNTQGFDLQGKWIYTLNFNKSTCIIDEDFENNQDYHQLTLEFSSPATLKFVLKNFADAACSQLKFSFEKVSTYKTANFESNPTQIDIDSFPQSIQLTFFEESSITSLNNPPGFCGITDWQKGVSRIFTSTALCPQDEELFDLAPSYGRLQFSADFQSFVFPDDAVHLGKTPQDRATKPDLNGSLVKQ